MAGQIPMPEVRTRLGKERKVTTYKCPSCNKTIQRDSEKAWIKSYCMKLNRYTRMIKQTEPCSCGADHSNEAKYANLCNYCLKPIK